MTKTETKIIVTLLNKKMIKAKTATMQRTILNEKETISARR